MTPCVHCRAEVGDRRWFDMPMCEPCEQVQRAALSRIAKQVKHHDLKADAEFVAALRSMAV